VPPYTYTDPCTPLQYAGSAYQINPFSILANESAFHAQTQIKVPLLNFYADDDPLVKPFHATMMAGYESGAKNQQTVLIQRGAHAYFYDRWWQQEAILSYFKAMLPGAVADPTITTSASVVQTLGGRPLSDQLVDLGSPTKQQADSYLAPYICDTSLGMPGALSQKSDGP